MIARNQWHTICYSVRYNDMVRWIFMILSFIYLQTSICIQLLFAHRKNPNVELFSYSINHLSSCTPKSGYDTTIIKSNNHFFNTF